MHTIHELQNLVGSEIEKEIETLKFKNPTNLYSPIAYALSKGGKRFRPLMVLLSYQLFKSEVEKAIPAAMAIEVFHNFTLLHDDIMDKAEMRRGSLTVHKKYDENTAILSGDAMSILAYNYFLNYDNIELSKMLVAFSQTAIEVCEGQQLDMDFESRLDVTIPEYIKMITLKTAVLLACSFKIGAIAANAPMSSADLLYSFGLNLGIAFQLQDDLLDVFSDQNKFGKKIGGDIIANKKTFLLLKALELANEKQKSAILSLISNNENDNDTKIRLMTDIYNELEIKKITNENISRYYENALSFVEKIDINQNLKLHLTEVADMIMNRDH